MSKRDYDTWALSIFGVFKISFLIVSFVFLSAFSFFKSGYDLNRKNVRVMETLGTMTSPMGIKKKNFSKQEVEQFQTRERAEIFKFILMLSDEISTSDAGKLAKIIEEECETYEIDPFLILAMIQIESRFDPVALSNKGAVGLMQVMPGTAKFVAEEFGVSIKGRKSLYDPFTNVRLGIYYFSYLIERFQSTEKALIAYNFGPNSFVANRSFRKRLPSYVRKVLGFKSFLEYERVIVKES